MIFLFMIVCSIIMPYFLYLAPGGLNKFQAVFGRGLIEGGGVNRGRRLINFSRFRKGAYF